MSGPSKIEVGIKSVCGFCWTQITNLRQSIIGDWLNIKPMLKACWEKKTVDSWTDLAQEGEFRWQIAGMIFKTFLLVFVVGVIALLPKHLITTAIPTKTSMSTETKQQSYTNYTPPKEYEIDNGRKKIIEVDADEQPPPGAHPYPNLAPIPYNRPVPMQMPAPAPLCTTLPTANLPVTPGINAPLPQQTIERSGVPLMPLGSRH